MTPFRFFQAVSVFLTILRIGILIYWFLALFNVRNAVTQWLEVFIQPFVSPFRQLSLWLMRKASIPLDFTYFFAVIGLSIVNRLWQLLYRLLYNFR